MKAFLLGIVLMALALVADADVIDVDVYSTSGYLEIDVFHYIDGNIGSHHWFLAQGNFEVNFSSYRNDGANSWYDELVTGIQAIGSGPTMFRTRWFQDFDETYVYGHYPPELEGQVEAYVFGTAGAMMNVGSSNFATHVSMDSYPAWSTPALMASGANGGYYELGTSVTAWLDGEIEASSSIYVFGSDGTAWQSFGYQMKAGQGSVILSGSCLGVIPPLGSVNGTHVYVDSGPGTYMREIFGADYVASEFGTFPGGAYIQATVNFFDGMHAVPWTEAH